MTKAIFTITAVVAVYLATSYFISRAVFCTTDFRFIDDVELVDIAIADEIHPRNATANIPVEDFADSKPLHFESIVDFKDNYRNCCQVLSDLKDERIATTKYGLLSRILGEHAATVRLKYNLQYVKQNGEQKELPVLSIVPLSSCGRILLEPIRGGFYQ